MRPPEVADPHPHSRLSTCTLHCMPTSSSTNSNCARARRRSRRGRQRGPNQVWSLKHVLPRRVHKWSSTFSDEMIR
eukprot:4617701-Prymnesium_polylepis.1